VKSNQQQFSVDKREVTSNGKTSRKNSEGEGTEGASGVLAKSAKKDLKKEGRRRWGRGQRSSKKEVLAVHPPSKGQEGPKGVEEAFDALGRP